MAFDHTSEVATEDVSRAKVVALVPKEGAKSVQVLVFPPTIRLRAIIRTHVSETLENHRVFEGTVSVGEGALEVTWGSGEKNVRPPEELQEEIRVQLEHALFGGEENPTS